MQNAQRLAGKRVFRSSVGCLGVILLVPTALMTLAAEFSGLPVHRSFLQGMLFVGLVGMFFLYVGLRERYEVTEEGVSYFSPWGLTPTQIRWADVQMFACERRSVYSIYAGWSVNSRIVRYFVLRSHYASIPLRSSLSHWSQLRTIILSHIPRGTAADDV